MIQRACFFLLSLPTKVFKCPSERDGRWGGVHIWEKFYWMFSFIRACRSFRDFSLRKNTEIVRLGGTHSSPSLFLAKDQTFSSFSNEGFPNSKSLFRYNFKKSSLIQLNVKIYNRLSHDRNKFSTHINYILFLAMLWAPLVIP